MVVANPTQDMPPPGGYDSIYYKRIPAKTYFKGWHWFAGILVIKALGVWQYVRVKRRVQYIEIEDRSAQLAFQPLLFAEQDRGVLKVLRKNREEEEAIMADVPNWEVGKYYNEPIYKTINPDKYVPPSPWEYFAHSGEKSFYDRIGFHLYN